jgi:hypothetical protein
MTIKLEKKNAGQYSQLNCQEMLLENMHPSYWPVQSSGSEFSWIFNSLGTLLSLSSNLNQVLKTTTALSEPNATFWPNHATRQNSKWIKMACFQGTGTTCSLHRDYEFIAHEAPRFKENAPFRGEPVSLSKTCIPRKEYPAKFGTRKSLQNCSTWTADEKTTDLQGKVSEVRHLAKMCMF